MKTSVALTVSDPMEITDETVELPGYLRHVRRVGDCWVWTGRFVAGEPVYFDYQRKRDENARRAAYRDVKRLKRGRRLIRLGCVTPGCISPYHHVPLSDVDELMQMPWVIGNRIEFEKVYGREHWFWRGANRRNPQVTIDGRTQSAITWLYHAVYPEKYRPGKRLFNRLDICNLFPCVNPDCHEYKGAFRQLYKIRRMGYETPCHIGLGAKTEDGYVRYKNDYLHRVRFVRETGKRLGEGQELHHLCGQPACCRPDHLRRLTKDDHLVVHGRSPRVSTVAEN